MQSIPLRRGLVIPGVVVACALTATVASAQFGRGGFFGFGAGRILSDDNFITIGMKKFARENGIVPVVVDDEDTGRLPPWKRYCIHSGGGNGLRNKWLSGKLMRVARARFAS